MKLLPELTDKDVGIAEPVEFHEQSRREVARVVVVDQQGKVALMYTAMYDYHKLPGGGLDEGENPQAAAVREALEETGCRVADVVELGRVDELRGFNGLRQINYGYLGFVKGSKGQPQFTDSEKREQFEVRWSDGTDAAIAVLEAEPHHEPHAEFMRIREIRFLEQAKLHIGQQ